MVDSFGDGYIILSRSLKDSDVFQNEKWLKVWIWCLLKANYMEKKVPIKTGRGNSVVTLKRGQFIYGRNSASKKLKMPPSTIRNIVYKLETCGNLDIKEDSHYSIVTIRNYDKYQNPENYKRTGKRTTKGQAKDTDNNDNNDNKVYISSFQEKFWPIYPRKADRKKALTVWQKLKPNLSLVQEIVSFVEKAKQSVEWTKEGGQFIPYPATFLNGHRWKDELTFKKDWRDS